MPKKSCHGCVYFIKLKDNKYGPGICDFYDGRVGSSNTACKYFKRIPYNRLEAKMKNIFMNYVRIILVMLNIINQYLMVEMQT